MSSPQDTSRQERPSPDAVVGAVLPTDEVSLLRKEVSELRVLLGQSAARIHRLESELQSARSQVAWFTKQVFGQKAERVSKAELFAAFQTYVKEQEEKLQAPVHEAPLSVELSSFQLVLDFLDPMARQDAPPAALTEAPAPALDPDAKVEPPTPPGAPPAPKKGHGRKRLPMTLREETIVLRPDHVPEGAVEAGAEVSYRVGVRRAELVRIAIVRPKYETVDPQTGDTRTLLAEPPQEMIPRGLLGPSALAHVIASKWDRHVPYQRQARFFKRSGYELAPSTLSGVAIRASPLAKDLVSAIEAEAKRVAPYLGVDATTVLLQEEEACHRGYVWLRYIENVCVLVNVTRTHDSESAGAQLRGFRCPTVADGAQVFDAEHRRTKNPRGGCWSHGRRNFIYAAPTDGRALVGVKWISQIFDIERELVNAPPEERLRVRQEKSAPLVTELFRWRDTLLAREDLGRSLLSKALRYLRHQEKRLSYFLQDGRVPIHNNETELLARHVAVGRKNWLFLGSDLAAEAASVWLSLVLSARMHELDVEAYLRDLFRVLPVWPKRRILELAPHRWKLTRPRLHPLEMCAELGAITVPELGT